MNLGREEEGLAHFRNAARIEPNDPTTRFNLAAVLQSRGELPQAMTEYASVIQLVSGNANAVGNSRLLADAFANLGTLYSETGDFGKARETYQQALQIDPFALDGLIGKFYQYVAVSPTGNGYLWLAEMLEQAGRTKEARAAYERALKLEPGLVEAERGLGQ
jgi:tetratricopeptide (TPR) repeat protein